MSSPSQISSLWIVRGPNPRRTLLRCLDQGHQRPDVIFTHAGIHCSSSIVKCIMCITCNSYLVKCYMPWEIERRRVPVPVARIPNASTCSFRVTMCDASIVGHHESGQIKKAGSRGTGLRCFMVGQGGVEPPTLGFSFRIKFEIK